MLMKNLKLTKPIALLLSGLMLVSTFTANVSAADTAKTTSGGDKASVISKSIEEVQEIMNAKSLCVGLQGRLGRSLAFD